MFDHRKALDIALNGTRVATHQGAVIFKWADDRQNPTDIIDGCLAQGFEGFLNNHTANAIVQKKFEQQGTVGIEGYQVATLNPTFSCSQRRMKIATRCFTWLQCILGGKQFTRISFGNLAQHLTVCAEHAG